jgi:hypothetical protein
MKTLLAGFALLAGFTLGAPGGAAFPPGFHAAKRTGRKHFPGARPFGDPLPGLTAGELAAFYQGKEAFSEADDAASGLGPIFNNLSCVACHSAGAPGGASAITVTRFGRMVNGQFDPLTALGGSLLQQNAIEPA